MTVMQELLADIYDRLYTEFGPQGWWPADSPFEMMVGAILVQNTAWSNVERAIANLRQSDLLKPQKLYAVDEARLQKLIRPAGYYRVKSARLRNLLRLIVDEFSGELDKLLALPAEELRTVLLSVNGVGPETADSILLYAAERPRFVVDAYTRRVLGRHGWLGADDSYNAMQELFETHVLRDVARYNEYHALIVAVAKQHCRTKPQCEGCPLQPLLPTEGPVV